MKRGLRPAIKVLFILSVSVLFLKSFPCYIKAEEHAHDLSIHLQDVQELLTKAQQSYDGIKDYTAEIHKEVFKGGGLEKEENSIIKFQKPFRLYLKWTSGKNKGAELLYVEGAYDNKIIVRKGGMLGILGTMEMAPDGFWLRNFTKHSIKEAGIGGIIDKSWQQFKVAKENKDIVSATCTLEQLDGRPAHKIVMVVSPEGKKNGYYCRTAIQYFDVENTLPIKSTFWLWEDELAEVFTYSKVKLNVGLTEKDFDKGNKEYRF